VGGRTIARAHVVVTGGAGFIGFRLCRALLSSGARVSVVTRHVARPSARALAAQGATVVAGDVADEGFASAIANLSPAAVLCHLAADVSVAGERLIATNLEGTRRALDAAEKLGVEYVVHASSIEAQGPAALAAIPLGDDDACDPVTPYGASKLASEEIARAWSRSTGRGVAVLRIGNTYGPGSPWLVRAAVLGLVGAAPLAPILPDIRRSRLQPLYVDDLVRALLRVLEARPSGTYAVPGDQAVTIADLLRELATLIGCEPELAAIERGATVAPDARTIDPDLAYFRLAGPERLHRVHDASRLRGEIGPWARVPLARGLAATLAWLCESGALAPVVPPARPQGVIACT